MIARQARVIISFGTWRCSAERWSLTRRVLRAGHELLGQTFDPALTLHHLAQFCAKAAAHQHFLVRGQNQFRTAWGFVGAHHMGEVHPP